MIDKSSFPAIRGDVNIMHHPETVASKWQKLDADGTAGQSALNAGIAATKAVYVGTAEALDVRKALAEHVSGRPVMTPKGLKLRHGFEREYGEGVGRIKARVLKTLDSYERQVAANCDHLREKVVNALKDRTTPPAIQAEVRAHVKSLPEKHRLDFVVSNGLAAYAAVASAPPFLSGLTANQLEIATNLAEQKFCPVEWAQCVAVHEIFAHLSQVRTTFLSWADAEMAEASTPAARAVNKVKGLGR